MPQSGITEALSDAEAVRVVHELRNREIHSQYLHGMTVAGLARKYSLSEKTIYRIVRAS